jgi:acid phosphatase type 7
MLVYSSLRKHLYTFALATLFLSSSYLYGHSTIRHMYMTWGSTNIHKSYTLTVHNLSSQDGLEIYYDTKPHHGKTKAYRYSMKHKGTRLYHLPDKRIVHHIIFPNLHPGETYYFIVGKKKIGFTEEKSFRTLPEEIDTLHVVEGGDWELSPGAEKVARTAAQQNPDAVFLGGDYPVGVNSEKDYLKWDQWLDMYTRTMTTKEGHLIPMILAIGNHEILEKNPSVSFFIDYFYQNPERQTYFHKVFSDDIALFVLDSGLAATHDGEQLSWMKKVLQKHNEKKIKIALYHIPIYPSVRFSEKNLIYYSLYTLLQLDDKNIAYKMFSPLSEVGRKTWEPVFDMHDLTVAFEHHDHALKRTYPLRNGSYHPHGTLYLGDGGWGCSSQYPTVQSYYNFTFAKTVRNRHFFWDVVITKDHIDYRAITSDGETIDECHQEINQ